MADYSLMPSGQIEAMLCARLEEIRLARNITQADLADEVGVSTRTIRRMESGEGTSLDTFIRIMKAFQLESRFEALLPNTDIQPLERVKKRSGKRERASGRRKKKVDQEPWAWGDE